ncbi:unnamed protein product [Merluccius merluccius]
MAASLQLGRRGVLLGARFSILSRGQWTRTAAWRHQNQNQQNRTVHRAARLSGERELADGCVRNSVL